jgi:hypothetical protein
MASIGNDRRLEKVISRADALECIVTYTLYFTDDEVGQNFDDSVKIWEKDTSDDDQISAYAVPETFTAQNGMKRTKSFSLSRGQANTEIGPEELYAWIWLRRTGSKGPAADEQKTPYHLTDV